MKIILLNLINYRKKILLNELLKLFKVNCPILISKKYKELHIN